MINRCPTASIMPNLAIASTNTDIRPSAIARENSDDAATAARTSG